MKLPHLIACFTIIFAKFSNGFEYEENLVSDPVVARKWVTAAQEFDDIVFPQKERLVLFLDKEVKKIPLSPSCVSSLATLSKGLRDKKFWAYQYLDASARGRSGLANGYIADMGDFGQCLTIREEGRSFRGAYCLLNVKFPLIKPPKTAFTRVLKLNLRNTELKDTLYEFYGNNTELFFYDTFTFALCMPSTCSDADLGLIVKQAFPGRHLQITTHGKCTRYDGFLNNFLSKPLYVKLSLFFIFFLAWLVAFSTIVAYFNFPGREYAEIFCAIRNTKKLTADYKDTSMRKLMFFDSFKCFFQIGGIFGHICTFVAVVPMLFATIQSMDKDTEDLWLISEFLQKAIYLTQVILLISGFFTAYFMVPIVEKSAGRLNFASYAIKRWLRTAPSTIVAIVMLFSVSAVVYGPLAEDLENTYLKNCRKNWYLTVLQINNFGQTYDTCLPQTWTQSADFHMWLLAFYPIKLLATNPRRGIVVCCALIAFGLITTMTVSYVKELPAPIGSTRVLEIIFLIIRGELFPAMAFHSYNSIANYFIGVLLGYMCYKEVKVGGIYIIAATVAAWIFFVTSIYGPYMWQHSMGMQFTPLANAVYMGLLKISFGLLWAVNIYIVYFYIDSVPMSEVVQSKLLTIFGRLSLSIYISQLAPVSYYFAMSYEPMPVNKYLLIIRVLSIVVQCCIMGYFTFLIVEAPFINLTKNLGFKASDARQDPVSGKQPEGKLKET